jgi:hypothetical protein
MSGVQWIAAVIAAIERNDRWSAYLTYHRATGEPLECCYKAVRNLAEETRRPFPAHWHSHQDDPELGRLRLQLAAPRSGPGRLLARLAGTVLLPLATGLALALWTEAEGWAAAAARLVLGPLLVLAALLGWRGFARQLRERQRLEEQT